MRCIFGNTITSCDQDLSFFAACFGIPNLSNFLVSALARQILLLITVIGAIGTLLPISCLAQQTPADQSTKTRSLTSITIHWIRGLITDAITGEALPGATIVVPRTQRGTQSDLNGLFVLNLNTEDTVRIVVNYAGYQSHSVLMRPTNAKRGKEFIIKLYPIEREAVEVLADQLASGQSRLDDARLGVESITAKEAKELPSFFGEADMLKVLQLKPGVQNWGEGNAGLYIRGGGADQNLMLMDDGQIYNAQHLYGFFSIFSPEAIDRVDLHKATFPAQFGGRLSSVVEFKVREGDKEKTHVGGGVGILSSRLTMEGPILKDKASYLISGRRTYFDTFTRLINKSQSGRSDYTPIPDYYFYDLNGKFAWQIGPKDKITLTGYFGQDVFSTSRERFKFDFGWSNSLGSLRWFRQYNQHLNGTLGISYSDYTYQLSNEFDTFSYNLTSGIRDYALRYDWTWTPTPQHLINLGGQATYHAFTVGRTSASGSDDELAFRLGQIKYAREGAIYVADDFSLSDRWLFNLGLRVSIFSDPTSYYIGQEPRASFRYRVNNWISAKAGYSRMYQYAHLVSSSGVALPTDFWYPSTNNILPQVGDQVGAGLTALLFGGKYLISTEIFYKNQQNQIDIKDGATLFPNNRIDTIFARGRGWAYGAEFYIEKKVGRTTGWIGYTLSYAWRQFDVINNGEPFHPRYDRRHDISIVVRHQFNKSLTLTSTWVFGTGNAITLPQGRSLIQDYNGTTPTPPSISILPQVNQRNWYRMEPNHRMDISLVWNLRPRWGESDITFSLYNVYNRANPYFIYFDNTYSGPNSSGFITGVQAKQVSLFPILPGLSYNFRY